jgi:DNA polymerase I-like protein with 3'-5' exonuclease and polymerase domains
MIQEEMERVVHPEFIIPLKVDFKVGKRWGSMVKWEKYVR